MTPTESKSHPAAKLEEGKSMGKNKTKNPKQNNNNCAVDCQRGNSFLTSANNQMVQRKQKPPTSPQCGESPEGTELIELTVK